MTPTVSVIVTTYNHERYIAQALESIHNQEFHPQEVVVVDDGSTDNTLRIAKDFEKYGMNILHKENGGPSSACNYAIQNSVGDILIIFSGDDILKPESIKTQVEALRSGHNDIVCSVPIFIGKENEELHPTEYPRMFRRFRQLTSAEKFNNLYYKGNYICAPSVAMTRNCWNSVGPFNNSLWQLQDYEYWLRACSKGKSFLCLSDSLIKYRWHGNNLSAGSTSRTLYELESVWNNVPNFLEHKMLMEVAFGYELGELDTELTENDIRMIIRCRHSNSFVRQYGHNQLRELCASASARGRLTRGIY